MKNVEENGRKIKSRRINFSIFKKKTQRFMPTRKLCNRYCKYY